MNAYQRWKRVRPVKSNPVGISTGSSCGAGIEPTVNLTIRRDVWSNTPVLGTWTGSEHFQITGTPDEMEKLGLRLIEQAKSARRMADENAGKRKATIQQEPEGPAKVAP